MHNTLLRAFRTGESGWNSSFKTTGLFTVIRRIRSIEHLYTGIKPLSLLRLLYTLYIDLRERPTKN